MSSSPLNRPLGASSPLLEGGRRRSQFTYRQFSQLASSNTSNPLRVIAHIDLDAFYAQCETVRLGIPEDKPLAVQQWQGLIAVNYPAREFGIGRHCNVEEAKKLCPELIVQHVATWREGDDKWAYREDAAAHIATDKVSLDHYRLQSRKILACIKEALPLDLQKVEKASIDEVFLDLSSQTHLILLERFPELSNPPPYDDPTENLPLPSIAALDWQTDALIDLDEEQETVDPDWDDVAILIGSEIVRKVRAEVRQKLGYTCSAGVASNKLLSKLGSAYKKPNKQTVVRNRAVSAFMAGFKITKLRNLGGKLGEQIVSTFNTESVIELLDVPLATMKTKLGHDTGFWIYNTIRGIDTSEVNSRTQIKSMLSAKSFRPTVNSSEQATRWLRIFAADIFARLVEEGVLENKRRPRTMNLHHRHEGQVRSRSGPIPQGRIIDEGSLFELAKDLLLQIIAEGRGVWPCANLSLSVAGFEDGVKGNMGIGAFLVKGEEAEALRSSIPDSRQSSTGPEPSAKKRRVEDGGIQRFFSKRPSTDHERTSLTDSHTHGEDSKAGSLPSDPTQKTLSFATKYDCEARHESDLAMHESHASPWHESAFDVQVDQKQHSLTDVVCSRCKASFADPEALQNHRDWHMAKDLQDAERVKPTFAERQPAARNSAQKTQGTTSRRSRGGKLEQESDYYAVSRPSFLKPWLCDNPLFVGVLKPFEERGRCTVQGTCRFLVTQVCQNNRSVLTETIKVNDKMLQFTVSDNDWDMAWRNKETQEGFSPASRGAQVSSVTAKVKAQPRDQDPGGQGRGRAVEQALQTQEVPTASGFGNVQRSTKIGRHWTQGCWQHGTDKEQASQDQDQYQGTHARGQRQLQIPQLGVGLGQGGRQASGTDSPREESVITLTAQPEEGSSSSIDEILAESAFCLEQPGDPSLYYLGLLQNQNQLHHKNHNAQQYQGFVGDDPSTSSHQQPQPSGFGYQHQHNQPPACSSLPFSFSFPPPAPPSSAPATSVFGLAPPPLPSPASPPRPPPRRRFQPTTSRRQQNLSHCRSNSNLSSSSSVSTGASRRLLASRSPASHSASGKSPRQRLASAPPLPQPIDSADPQDTPTAHHRHSPFLPPHPHLPASSLSACSTLSALSTSSPSSPISGSISSSPALLSTFSSISSSSSSHLTSSSAISSPHINNMSRSSRNAAPTTSGTGRQNEYFVPRDGIDREVISADICRYLGNDALVRPGHYENPQTGQAVQGYYITAYRNLTTAMIEDLKADSARWDSERRAQTSRNTSGGTIASRNVGVPPRHSSNSPVVQYRYSETHQSRQHHGPTEGPYQTDPYARDPGFDGPRYPGTGAPGYTGAAGSYGQSYGASSSGAFAGYAQTQQSPPPADTRFSSTTAATMDPSYQASQSPYVAVGTNQRPRGGYDPYANQMATSSAAAQQAYATAAPTQQGYTATAYPYSGQAPPAGYAMQPQDPFYGRVVPPAADVVSERATGTAQTDTTDQAAGKRMRPCCIRFTLGHGAELEKGRGAIPYQVDLGWYLDVMTLLSGRTLRGSILFSVLPGSGWFLLSTPMSLAPGFFGVYHRRDAVFIGIIIGRGRHPDSKLGAHMNSLDSDTSYWTSWTSWTLINHLANISRLTKEWTHSMRMFAFAWISSYSSNVLLWIL
ncbi:hypothetical protein IWW34DRAFT_816707 [Fusarium oxysporum f. sp. albedinis]|nr:hypothetical protein IWW34DRAFT_816707 [Fusarium oxysporum f. sp. albedinis]